ncbi:hypothetical protein O181_099041 [Austropuccinia psidii MF-1]|uniref:Uncharacterized protein n=1 Tax=Austropuccinia psidii MF-1 TaxID=1389203 RepID=A0A9Q3PGH5_9BASI|nr:hypothetical protein [Austropuccinia psidii MF-1]
MADCIIQANWANLSQFWPQNPTNPELAKITLGHGIGQEPQNGHNSVGDLWQPPEAISSASSKDSTQVQGKTFPSAMHPVLKDPGVVIPNQAPNPSPILKEDSSATQSGNSLAATRSPAAVGLSILIRAILSAIFRGYQSFQSLSRHQLLSIPWTTQLVHTGSNQASCMALGQSIFHCGNSVTQFNSQDGQNCIGPIQTIQPGDSPSRISLSDFHIYWPPFITWGLFSPVN